MVNERSTDDDGRWMEGAVVVAVVAQTQRIACLQVHTKCYTAAASLARCTLSAVVIRDTMQISGVSRAQADGSRGSLGAEVALSNAPSQAIW